MKTIIAGSRDITDSTAIFDIIRLSEINITEVVSGNARGVDRIGEQYASINNIKTTLFPADWKEYGKAAGPIRNKQMALYADALIAIWDGKSKGTKNMIDEALKANLHVCLYIITTKEIIKNYEY